MKLRSLMTLFVLLLFCGFAGPRSADAATEEEIETARQKGVEFLKAQQGTDGSWFFSGHTVGITALGGMALIENGVPVSDPSVELAHGFVRKNLSDLKSTYDLALAILFLSRVGDRDNRTPIRDMAARLIAGQNVEGGWTYTCPLVNAIVLTNSAQMPEPPEGAGDNSCTQFAVLGLWIASRWGVNIDDAMLRVGTRFIDTQMEDGGWAYNHTADAPQSGNSMTYAGLFCLTVAKATELRKMQERARTEADGTERLQSDDSIDDDPVFARGLEKAGAFAQGINQNQARYFLWSVERLGVLLELDTIGTTDWFDKGSDALVKSQREDGAWVNSNETWGNIADTSFAVLFLRKANLGSDISRLLRGEPAEKFSNMTKPDRPRYLKLTDALKEAEAGDLIRVDGAGPFDMPHIDIDKDITIEAGPGYAPVFRYDIGYDESGRRSRPEDDPNARFMLRVNSGTLTLEGLELQVDPPALRSRVSWAGIAMNGGNLRILNCSVAEANKQGAAPIVMSQPGSVLVRNSTLIGGRAGIEVLTTGEQDVTLENSVVFSTSGFNVFNGPEGTAPRLTLKLDRCVIQAKDVFSFSKLTNPVEMTSIGTAYKADFMGQAMVATPKRPEHLTWTGQDNVYDATRWLAAAPSVKDEKTWNTYWGGTDEAGIKRVIPFLGKLRQEAFSHSVRGEDFEFDPESALHQYRRKSGINPLVVGPGNGYLRYRESFEYRTWEGEDEAVVAADMP